MPFWDFFETSVGHGLRQDREALLGEAVEIVSEGSDVVFRSLLDAEMDVRPFARQVDRARPDVLVLVVTMAAPPDSALSLLSELVKYPVVVWSCAPIDRIDHSFSHGDITRHGATVGAPMITSVLVRDRRAFDLIHVSTRSPGVSHRVSEALLAAGTAARLRTARIGRIGAPIPGYASVDTPDDLLAADVGTQVEHIDPEEFVEAYQATGLQDVEEWKSEHARLYAWQGAPPDKSEQGVRAVVALTRLGDRHRLSAGAMNCHIPQIRTGPGLGFAPCFALGHCTSSGVPWTCTGDVLASVAMLATKSLTGTSIYQEIEAHDGVRDEFLIANSGEHDLSYSTVRPSVTENPWWPQGICASSVLPAGDATLVSFCRSGAGGYRLVVAEGTFTGKGCPGTGTVNGFFQFSATSGGSAWVAWCLAGAGHHSAAARGHIAASLARVGRHLGLEVVSVAGFPGDA